jgi:hypothetical protein
MNKVIKKVVLPNSPPKNPQPSLSEGGDCGACVLAGILGTTVSAAYEFHASGQYYGGKDIPKVSCFNNHSMKRTLESLTDDIGLNKMNGHSCAPLEHVVTDIPLWLVGQHHDICGMAFGVSASMQSSAWSDYVRAMLSAGYYGICQVYDGGHKVSDESKFRQYGMTNHWVMIAGWQYVYYKGETSNSGHYAPEVGIRNSSHANPDEQWIPIGDFLKYWGGFGVMWALPINK